MVNNTDLILWPSSRLSSEPGGSEPVAECADGEVEREHPVSTGTEPRWAISLNLKVQNLWTRQRKRRIPHRLDILVSVDKGL